MQLIKDSSNGVTGNQIGKLALQTLSELGRKTATFCPEAPDRAPLISMFLRQLHDAVLSSDPAQLDDAIDLMRRGGVNDTAIIDHYIPATARRLGTGWCEDTLDFAGVSIACARLQAVLRRLDKSWRASVLPGIRPALVVIPNGMQHTLGATVLTQQLRRAGVEVAFALDVCAETLASLIRRHAPGVLALSSSPLEGREPLRTLVQTARAVDPKLPVVIGGCITTESGPDLREIFQADLVSNAWQDLVTLLRSAESS